jgi:hypothetical protein
MRKSLQLTLIGVTSLSLAGCVTDLAAAGCKKLRSDVLQVGTSQSCRFRYDQGDVAKYVVVVMRPPAHGEAVGEGQYLKYVAKPGFVGEDRLTIKVERRGVGHVQWQTLTVRVNVGPTA